LFGHSLLHAEFHALWLFSDDSVEHKRVYPKSNGESPPVQVEISTRRKRRRRKGACNVIVVPCPASARISTVPPMLSARRFMLARPYPPLPRAGSKLQPLSVTV